MTDATMIGHARAIANLCDLLAEASAGNRQLGLEVAAQLAAKGLRARADDLETILADLANRTREEREP